MSTSGVCKACGGGFRKRARDSDSQWTARKFCSRPCSNKYFAPLARRSVEERFWRFVNRRKEGCWEWAGSRDAAGYGRLQGGRGVGQFKAHRISWSIHFGEIPPGLHVLHACDNPGCVNPGHLMVGTQKANLKDCSTKKRLNPKSLENLINGRNDQ